jgi:hypothetical protein
MLIQPLKVTPVVTVCAEPRTSPLDSSIGIRQMFMAAARSLQK